MHIYREVFWQTMYWVLNQRFFDGRLNMIPVYHRELDGELAEYGITAFTPYIIINLYAEVTICEMTGVLLHKICHQAVLEEVGIKSCFKHDINWINQMRKCGFKGRIDEWTIGEERFLDNHKEYLEIYDSVVEFVRNIEDNF